MTRISCAAALLVAAFGIGCSSGEGGAATPTSPTPSTTTTGGGSSPTNQSCVPAAPGNLRVTVTGSRRVFNWDSVSNVQDYFIQIAQSGSNTFLVDTNTTQTTYEWTGASSASYWARVYARNSCGSGPNSSQITFN